MYAIITIKRGVSSNHAFGPYGKFFYSHFRRFYASCFFLVVAFLYVEDEYNHLLLLSLFRYWIFVSFQFFLFRLFGLSKYCYLNYLPCHYITNECAACKHRGVEEATWETCGSVHDLQNTQRHASERCLISFLRASTSRVSAPPPLNPPSEIFSVTATISTHPMFSSCSRQFVSQAVFQEAALVAGRRE